MQICYHLWRYIAGRSLLRCIPLPSTSSREALLLLLRSRASMARCRPSALGGRRWRVFQASWVDGFAGACDERPCRKVEWHSSVDEMNVYWYAIGITTCSICTSVSRTVSTYTNISVATVSIHCKVTSNLSALLTLLSCPHSSPLILFAAQNLQIFAQTNTY